jgi:hypothetical protein
MARRAEEALQGSAKLGLGTVGVSALASAAGAVAGEAVGRSTRAALTGAAVGAFVGAVASEAVTARQCTTQEQEMTKVVGYLNDNLGDVITAYLSGSEDLQDVQRWISGEVVPQELPAERLRSAYEAARCLVDAIGSMMASSWFLGMNEFLDQESPAAVLRHGQKPEDWRLVIPAAEHMAEIAR